MGSTTGTGTGDSTRNSESWCAGCSSDAARKRCVRRGPMGGESRAGQGRAEVRACEATGCEMIEWEGELRLEAKHRRWCRGRKVRQRGPRRGFEDRLRLLLTRAGTAAAGCARPEECWAGLCRRTGLKGLTARRNRGRRGRRAPRRARGGRPGVREETGERTMARRRGRRGGGGGGGCYARGQAACRSG